MSSTGSKACQLSTINPNDSRVSNPLVSRAVDLREPRPFHGTAEDGELLPKSDILESQLATSLIRQR